MNAQIQIFDFNQKQLRVELDDNGNPLFCAKDVCEILGYANDSKAIMDHCRKDGVTKRDLIDNLGRKQNAAFLDEGNLYRLILRSNKPEAKPFETRLCDEILPSIRKTGGYNQDRQIENLINEVQQIKSIILSMPAYKPANQLPALSQKEINAIKTDTFTQNAESAIIAYIENKGQCTRREMVNSLRATQPFKSVGKGRTQLLNEYINKLKFAKKIKISDESFFLLA